VILLSGRSGEELLLEAFDAGADDYVAKPFGVNMLVARVEAVGRRALERRPAEPSHELALGPLVMDVDSHEVHHPDGTTVRLTRTEFHILEALVRSSPRVVPNERLVNESWRVGGGSTTVLKTHISHLRTKLRLGHGVDATIVAVPEVGYQLRIQ
jgi:two-component system KDP operon response regulator KdpE